MSERDRDAAVERLLERALTPAAGAPAKGQCVDAETLAALADRTLPAPEQARVEAHTSTCARCQAILATIVRTAPVAPPAPAWWRLPLVRWAAPLAAAAIAVTIWVVVDREPAREERQTSAPATIAPAPAPAQPSIAAPPSAPAPPAREALGGQRAVPGIAAPPVEASKSAPRTRVQERTAKAPLQDAARADAGRRPAVTEMKGAPSAKAEAQGQVMAAAPPPPTAAAAGAAREAAPLAESVFVGPLEILTPDAAVKWRVILPSRLERTTNGGATWQRQSLPSDESAIVSAGSAPAATVCWLAGRSGRVWVTTDGTTWRAVTFPEPVNLVNVVASGPLSAAVTAVDGRVFVTSDGGITWSVRR